MADDANDQIPLPPQDIIDQMVALEPEAAAPKKTAAAPVALLHFTGPKPMHVEIPLDFPFEWEGREINAITVCRLTTQGIADLGDRLGGSIELMDLYAVMTGLPASVLRGLEAGDGERVTGAAYDFLPRAFRTGSD